MPRSRHGWRHGLFDAAGIASGLLVLFLLSGRWSLSRMTEMDLGLLGEPRLLVVLLLLAIGLAPGWRDATDIRARRAVARTLLLTLSFYGYMALSTSWAPDDADPLKLVELALVLACLGATLRLTRAMEPAQISSLVWRWLIPSLGAFALLGAVMGSGGERLAVLGGGPNVFGRNMGLLCVALLAQVLRPRGSWLALCGTVVAGALVVLSGSRGALVATSVGAGVVLYFNTGQLRRVAYVGLVVLVIAVGVVELTEFGSKVAEMFRHRVLHLAIEDGYDSGRTDVYASAWELGLESPWFGIGLAGFEILGNHFYPHNLFLEVFCEGGLFGIVLLLALLLPPLVALVRRSPGPDPRDYGGFLVVLVSAQFSGDLYDSRTIFVLAILITVLAARGSRPVAQERSATPCNGPAEANVTRCSAHGPTPSPDGPEYSCSRKP